MESSSLAIQPMPRSLLQMSDSQMNKLLMLAEMISASKLAIGKNGRESLSKADAFMILLKGISLGMNEMAALEAIDLISGKPAVDGQGMLGLCYASDELEDIQITATDDKCTVMMKRKGKTPHTEVFGKDEATKYMTTEWVNGSKREIPLIEKANYKSQPRTMFKWRAIAACARVVFPDKVQGLYTKEELGANVAVTEDGAMIVQEVPALPRQQQPAQIPATVEPSAQTTPTEPEPEHSANEWVNGNVKAWVDKWTGQGMTTDQLMKALGIEGRWGNYKGTVSEADKAVEAYRAKPAEAAPIEPTTTPDEAESRAAALARINGEMVLIRNAEKREYVRGNGHKAGYKWDGFADITETDGMVFPVRISLFPEDIEAIEEKNHVWPKTDGPVDVTVTLDTTDRNVIRIKDVLKKPNPFGKVDATSQQMFDNLPGISDAARNQLESV